MKPENTKQAKEEIAPGYAPTIRVTADTTESHPPQPWFGGGLFPLEFAKIRERAEASKTWFGAACVVVLDRFAEVEKERDAARQTALVMEHARDTALAAYKQLVADIATIDRDHDGRVSSSVREFAQRYRVDAKLNYRDSLDALARVIADLQRDAARWRFIRPLLDTDGDYEQAEGGSHYEFVIAREDALREQTCALSFGRPPEALIDTAIKHQEAVKRSTRVSE